MFEQPVVKSRNFVTDARTIYRGQRVRIGIGEYYRPDPAGEPDRVVRDAQLTFVEKLDELAPEIGRNLTDRVTPLAHMEGSDQHVGQEVELWRTDFNLLDDWIVDTGINFFRWGGPVVYDWRYQWFFAALGQLPTPSGQPLQSEEFPSGPFHFGFPSLDLTLHTLDELSAGIRGQFEKALARYLGRIRREAAVAGWETTVAKRVRAHSYDKAGRLNEARHFEWLVRYQCFGQTYEQIARRFELTKPTVGEAVRRLMELTRLTPRPVQKGRKALARRR